MSKSICDLIRGYKSNNDLKIDFNKEIFCFIYIYLNNNSFITIDDNINATKLRK